ncbi:type II toxin-antitoxin system prevent-host-death family antitoxin [Jannaschia rubra]|uniref:Prevent-host-death family protein n=1 Tax=Jannaschia rubra TaxID=282197 RepID=A0A0M6XPS0_9RHOB|nr:type II toxin-antitoxin system prevent-host-death family antitoxin [Jannaschia rubra]CTQ33150.1 prevent-host-death family protein [Jannaschia rubra]SFG79607.1 prevent-host-death family protein [Jannaschia rubra]
MSTRMTSTEFNRDSGAAKRASEGGPLVITDRGAPSHVLMTWADYRRLSGRERTVAEALALPGVAEIDFDPPRLGGGVRAADLD